MTIESAEIVGLVGENGAGKSTLVKLLSGVHSPDRGTIRIAGREVAFTSPRDALDAGIATIHQEIECFAHLSVAENMLLGEAWPRSAWRGVDWPALHAEAARRLSEFGLPLDTHRTLAELTAAEKQEIAIAGALSRKARLLILDEPTASLTEPEVKRLFSHLRRLRAEGVTILYISHRLDEILELTDRIVVLRDGALVAACRTCDIDAGRLVHEMVGRPLDQVYPRTRSGKIGAPLLELNGVSSAGFFRKIGFSVYGGEIVGLAGLIGAGRSELARAVYGLYAIDAGTMQLGGRPWKPSHPRQSLDRGLVYIPEERKRQGLVLAHSLRDSISIGFSDRLTRLGLIRTRRERECVGAAMASYDIRALDPRQAIGTLSGGNQQKALVARWIERDPCLVILDEPTRGVDVGAKTQIHALVDRLAAEGKGVLFISSDLPEIVGMSDRILVMNRGTVEVELRGAAMTAHNVVLAASGLYEQAGSSTSTERDSNSRVDMRPAPFEKRADRFWHRMPRSVRRRIAFLFVADILVLCFLAWRTTASGTSFSDELGRMVPNVAPTVLAGLGLTGIICCGAIDLSIGSILAVAGTVFGILHAREFGPIFCFAACFFTACGLSAYNGLLIRWLKIPAIIVTLAGLAFYRGLALILADVGAGIQRTIHPRWRRLSQPRSTLRRWHPGCRSNRSRRLGMFWKDAPDLARAREFRVGLPLERDAAGTDCLRRIPRRRCLPGVGRPSGRDESHHGGAGPPGSRL